MAKKTSKKIAIYVKGRGWLKTIKSDKPICCRSAGDIHADYIFKTKKSAQEFMDSNWIIFNGLDCSVKILERLDVVDKRVVPSKKINLNKCYPALEFNLENITKSFSFKDGSYCAICHLGISHHEPIGLKANLFDYICIHCLKEIMKDINKRYDKMDDDIKRAWERAKLIDIV